MRINKDINGTKIRLEVVSDWPAHDVVITQKVTRPGEEEERRHILLDRLDVPSVIQGLVTSLMRTLEIEESYFAHEGRDEIKRLQELVKSAYKEGWSAAIKDGDEYSGAAHGLYQCWEDSETIQMLPHPGPEAEDGPWAEGWGERSADGPEIK